MLADIPKIHSNPLFSFSSQLDIAHEQLRRKPVNEIANHIFVVSEVPNPLLQSLPALAQKHPQILEQHCIPTDVALWQAQHFEAFLSARRELITAAINARLDLFSAAPQGSVGFTTDVRYRGSDLGAVSTNLEPYRHVIHTLLTWEDAWPLWLALGFSLASPAIARLRLRRNPVLYFAGPSNSGKTTITQISTGVWGDPTKKPLRVEAGRTTRAGYLQTLEGLGGLPLFIDEAHMARDPLELETLTYDFANGQTYTKGGKDGQARGGEALAGVLMLAGEAALVFRHAGAHRRVLWVDAAQWSPLGASPESTAGKQRAIMLEEAWLNGAGALGLEFARAIWTDWPKFLEAVHRLQGHQALGDLGIWQPPLAVAAAALYVALQRLNLKPPPQFSMLLPVWTEMLTSGQEQTDPAAETWEQVVLLLAQADKYPAENWTIAKLHDEPIAYLRHGDDYWRVPTGTPQFLARVGTSACQLHGRTWARRGLIRPAPDGSSTTTKTICGGQAKCLLVHVASLIRGAEYDEE